jgi:N-acetylmuramoyl-L-alanine amidase
VCTPLPQRKTQPNGWQTHHFLIPKTKIGGESTGAIKDLSNSAQALSAEKSTSYTIQVKAVTTPVDGILVAVSFDPTWVGFECTTVVAVQGQPSVIFKFYNKHILNEIGKKTDNHHHLAVNKRKARIVIDSGHGAEDDGKVGCFGIKEKDINLAVAKRVAYFLRKEGMDVCMTREDDRFIPLEHRTTYANKNIKADLFVSIHANGAPNESASGIETFCAQPHLFSDLMREQDPRTYQQVARSESQRCNLSCKLAQSVHEQVISHARTVQADVKDRKVKNTVSQVLLGTDMPSALIEIGFLSNAYEARLLSTPLYQDTIAQGICKGIVSYIKSCA